MKLRLILPILFISSLSLISCGGSDGGDDENTTGVAIITTENEAALATAATEAAKAAINNAGVGFKKAAKNYEIAEFDMAALVDMSEVCVTGNASTDINENTGNGVITYDSCDFGGVFVNGTVTLTTTNSGDVWTTSIVYNNFTVSAGGITETLDLTTVCTSNINTGATSCTYDSKTLGIDGRTYSVSGASVSGNSFNGYTVSATVTDPDYGTLSITTNSAITFNCSNGQPDSGEIQFTDGSGNTVVVTFNSCSSFTVSYNGSSTMYSW